MVISAVPFTGAASSAGSGTTFTYDSSTGVLTFSGTGAVTNHDWGWQRDHITKVIIEDGITSVDFPFELGAGKPEEVVIGSGMEELIDGMFKKCKSLKKITINGNNLKRVGDFCFYGCAALEELVLPSSVTETGEYAFAGSVIKEIIIPAGVSAVSDDAFIGCADLEKVSCAEGSVLSSVGRGAFLCCSSLKELELPDRVDIDGSAFAACSSLPVEKVAALDDSFEIKDNVLYKDNRVIYAYAGDEEITVEKIGRY